MSKVLFKKDIDKIVAEKLGWSVEKVSANSEHLFKRLAEQMDDPSTISISIPKMGVMSVKSARVDKFIRLTETSIFQAGVKKLKNLETKKMELYRQVSTWTDKKRHWERPRILRHYFSQNMNFEELEKHQNERL